MDTSHLIRLVLALEFFLLTASVLFIYHIIYSLTKGGPTLSSNRKILKKLASPEMEKYFTGKKQFYELGASYGRVLFFISKKYRLVGKGYETNLCQYLLHLPYKLIFHPRSKSVILPKSFLESDIEKAEVVYCFLTPHLLKKVEDALLPKMRPGAILISNSFPFTSMPPLEILPGKKGNLDTIYVYRVPSSNPNERK